MKARKRIEDTQAQRWKSRKSQWGANKRKVSGSEDQGPPGWLAVELGGAKGPISSQGGQFSWGG